MITDAQSFLAATRPEGAAWMHANTVQVVDQMRVDLLALGYDAPGVSPGRPLAWVDAALDQQDLERREIAEAGGLAAAAKGAEIRARRNPPKTDTSSSPSA